SPPRPAVRATSVVAGALVAAGAAACSASTGGAETGGEGGRRGGAGGAEPFAELTPTALPCAPPFRQLRVTAALRRPPKARARCAARTPGVATEKNARSSRRACSWRGRARPRPPMGLPVGVGAEAGDARHPSSGRLVGLGGRRHHEHVAG